MRAAMIALVAAVAACHGEPLGPGPDMSYGADMAVCQGRTPPASPTPCGPDTCAAGQICFVEHPGYCNPPDLAPPPDGGGGGGGGGGPNTCVRYQCVAPPPAFADCDCHPACDHYVGASPIICSYDGAILSCVYN